MPVMVGHLQTPSVQRCILEVLKVVAHHLKPVCSSRDVDYLHVVNWKKAVELIKQGKYEIINGHKVIPIKTAVANNILFLVPEPKSPHGVDVSPDGKYIIVAGKLDSHAWVLFI